MVGGDDANHGLMSPRGKTQTSSMLKIASARGGRMGSVPSIANVRGADEVASKCAMLLS